MLSDKAIQALRPDPERPGSKHHDRDGLYLWVARSGSKTWRKDYCWQGAPQGFSQGRRDEDGTDHQAGTEKGKLALERHWQHEHSGKAQAMLAALTLLAKLTKSQNLRFEDIGVCG